MPASKRQAAVFSPLPQGSPPGGALGSGPMTEGTEPRGATHAHRRLGFQASSATALASPLKASIKQGKGLSTPSHRRGCKPVKGTGSHGVTASPWLKFEPHTAGCETPREIREWGAGLESYIFICILSFNKKFKTYKVGQPRIINQDLNCCQLLLHN